MIRALIFLFALANLLVFALSAGWLGSAGSGASGSTESGESHLPLSPDRIRIVSQGEPPPIVEPPKQCMEWIELGATRLAALEKLATGSKAVQLAREETQAAQIEHRLFIPLTGGGKPAAEKKAAELKKLGVKNFQLERENGGERWAVLLGVYPTEEAAEAGLAAIRKLGVRSATRGLRERAPAHFRVRLSGPPAALVAVRKLELPGSRDCTSLPDMDAETSANAASPPTETAVPAAMSPVLARP